MNNDTESESIPDISPGRKWRRRLLVICIVLLVLIAGLLAARALYAFRDRTPGYALNLNLKAPAQSVPGPLRAGFGRVKINPDIADPQRPVWLAGFSQHRAATAIHDDLWAIACVIDDGQHRIGLVVLDAIGLFHDDVITIRQSLPAELDLDYTVVCSTHNHSTPDLMGLWGPNYLRSGVDPKYRRTVMDGAVESLKNAVRALEPARFRVAQIRGPVEAQTDTRRPRVLDSGIRIFQVMSVASGAILGSIIGWANHPETVWSHNTEITADFCGYLRDALEKGIMEGDRQLAEGVGGIHLYINGAVGGLMTTSPSVTVRDPYLGQEFKEPSHAKARALGNTLSWMILPVMRQTNAAFLDPAFLEVYARTIEVKLENPAFMLAPIIGLMDRGHSRWMHLRTEVALIRLGEVSFACVPGEIYPEIINGGIERAPGGDYDIEPVEVPPLRDMMPGRAQFVFGLANDEIGYLIPKSEWDRKPPYLYDAKNGVYGEVNSVGPNAASTIHAGLAELCRLAKE